MWCEVGTQLHYFAREYPFDPATLVKRLFLSELSWHFHQNQLAINIRVDFWTLTVCDLSLCLLGRTLIQTYLCTLHLFFLLPHERVQSEFVLNHPRGSVFPEQCHRLNGLWKYWTAALQGSWRPRSSSQPIATSLLDLCYSPSCDLPFLWSPLSLCWLGSGLAGRREFWSGKGIYFPTHIASLNPKTRGEQDPFLSGTLKGLRSDFPLHISW